MSTLVYDGDCAFCTASVRWVERLHLQADEIVAWQHADLGALGLTEAECTEAVQYVHDDGSHESGHLAVAGLLGGSQPWWRPAGSALRLPVVSPLAARAYAWVSANRSRLPGGTAACALPPSERPGAA